MVVLLLHSDFVVVIVVTITMVEYQDATIPTILRFVTPRCVLVLRRTITITTAGMSTTRRPRSDPIQTPIAIANATRALDGANATRCWRESRSPRGC